jgi:hypothetical protein
MSYSGLETEFSFFITLTRPLRGSETAFEHISVSDPGTPYDRRYAPALPDDAGGLGLIDGLRAPLGDRPWDALRSPSRVNVARR